MTPEQALETLRRLQIADECDPYLDVLAHELERLGARADNLAFELGGLEAMRLKDNAYLIAQRDAAVAERDEWHRIADDNLDRVRAGDLKLDAAEGEARLLREALERLRAWLTLNMYGGGRSEGARIIDDALARAALRGHDPAGDHGPGTTSYPDSAAAEGRDEGWAARELAQAEKDIDALPGLVRGQRQPEEPRT